MTDDAEKKKTPDPARPPAPRRARGAWHPFTGGGIAAFADATARRVLLFMVVFAAATAGSFAWVLWTGWWPVFDQAAAAFPGDPAVLSAGRLAWPDAVPRILADSPQFGIAHRPEDAEPAGRTADLQLELTRTHLRLAGIAGFVDLPWPQELSLSLDRRGAVAGWGAWRWPLLAGLFGIAAVLLLALWTLLATLHAVPAWLAGLIFRRSLSLSEAWKLCAAGTLIGGSVLGAALFGYSVRLFPWPILAAAAAAQLVPVWIWTAWAVIERPARPPKETPRPKAKNPFKKPPAEKGDAKEVRTQPKRKNPFRGGNAG